MKRILRRHTAISKYIRRAGGGLDFTRQYLPLFYSGNSPDIVIQNVIIVLLGKMLQHIGSFSFKTVSISFPAAKFILTLSQLKTGGPSRKITARLKQVFARVQFGADRLLLKRSDHHSPPAASA